MSRRIITFEESLGNSDWGLIIDKKGNLKGLFIPDGSSEDDVPENIIQLCCVNLELILKNFIVRKKGRIFYINGKKRSR